MGTQELSGDIRRLSSPRAFGTQGLYGDITPMMDNQVNGSETGNELRLRFCMGYMGSIPASIRGPTA